jgi:hypothetical protein
MFIGGQDAYLFENPQLFHSCGNVLACGKGTRTYHKEESEKQKAEISFGPIFSVAVFGFDDAI